MLRARLRCSLRAHWGWLIAVLACKENMALLISAYCAVHVVLERKRPLAELRAWYLWPMAFSVLWFLVCAKLITPALNSGSIDYLALYDRLGASAGDILLKAITQPQRILGALFQSLTHGNLFWALLLPFLAVPLIRPRWLLIATADFSPTPFILAFFGVDDLLSLCGSSSPFVLDSARRRCRGNRSVDAGSGWDSTLTSLSRSRRVHRSPNFSRAGRRYRRYDRTIGSVDEETRARKRAFISQIPPDASVVAPLPYLSHLAMREKLYSLHYVLKGLKTLSRSTYSPPPPTDFVLIDYDDSATFDAVAGYYHPAMRTADGRVIPSSDRLLHEFLQRCSWTVHASDELTLLQQGKSTGELPSSTPSSGGIVEVAKGNALTSIVKSSNELTEQGLEIKMSWTFQEPREVFPWMFLKLTPRDHRKGIVISRGLCAPEATNGPYQENWQINPSKQIPEGDYEVEVFFVDNARRVWAAKLGQPDAQAPLLSPPVSIGELTVAPGRRTPSRN